MNVGNTGIALVGNTDEKSKSQKPPKGYSSHKVQKQNQTEQSAVWGENIYDTIATIEKRERINTVGKHGSSEVGRKGQGIEKHQE